MLINYYYYYYFYYGFYGENCEIEMLQTVIKCEKWYSNSANSI